MKLVSLSLSQAPQGIRPALTFLTVGADGPYRDWTIRVRGPSVLLVSPPGWRQGYSPEGTARRVIEIPRAACTLHWSAEEGEFEDEAEPPAIPQGMLATGVTSAPSSGVAMMIDTPADIEPNPEPRADPGVHEVHETAPPTKHGAKKR